ncbi:thiamine-phosphate synthase family protein [Sulfurisphaera ohwakuensis]|uniref:thiamine-phosphate synthase family protein n=1 Tax=Sulfurisphaera ohwakuensis TaxID=69656 RepID=UPI0036F1D2C3
MVKTPLELITDNLLPTIKVLIAKKLRELGMSQNRIAILLGVTQPAVKQYLDEDENFQYKKLRELGLKDEEIEDIIQDLVNILNKNDTKSAMYYITDIGLRYLSELKFCKFHKENDKYIPQDCDICRYIYRQNEEERMEIALSMLQNEFVTPLIPEVLSNLAFARKNPKGINDVLAVEGRITKVKGIPTPASNPSWGSSKHLATILLKIMQKDPSIRSIMNIKYDKKIDEALHLLNFRIVYVGPSDETDDESISNLIYSAFYSGMDCVVHLGGKGLEPITYVLGKDPVEVVKKVIEIGKKYRELTEN